jgi:hypothetical protein
LEANPGFAAQRCRRISYVINSRNARKHRPDHCHRAKYLPWHPYHIIFTLTSFTRSSSSPSLLVAADSISEPSRFAVDNPCA